MSNSNTQRAKIKNCVQVEGRTYSISIGEKKDLLYFFICKHELKFNIGLLNLGQAA